MTPNGGGRGEQEGGLKEGGRKARGKERGEEEEKNDDRKGAADMAGDNALGRGRRRKGSQDGRDEGWSRGALVILIPCRLTCRLIWSPPPHISTHPMRTYTLADRERRLSLTSIMLLLLLLLLPSSSCSSHSSSSPKAADSPPLKGIHACTTHCVKGAKRPQAE